MRRSQSVLTAKPTIAPTLSWEDPYVTFNIVWHPCCAESDCAARRVIEHFTRDRYSIEEMGVSVFEWSTPALSLRELKLMDGFGFDFLSLSQWMSEVS